MLKYNIKWLIIVLILSSINIPYSVATASGIGNLSMVSAFWFDNALTDEFGRTTLTSHVTPQYNNSLFNYGIGVQNQIYSTNNYYNVSAPDSPTLSITGNQSYSAWVFINATVIPAARSYTIFDKYSAPAGARAIMLRHDPTTGSCPFRLAFFVAQETSAVKCAVCSLIPTPQGSWFNIVATFTPNEIQKIYINGTLISNSSCATAGQTAASGVADSTSRFGIGGTGIGGNQINGTIDEFIIWNRTLSASEISTMYNDYLAGHRPTEEWSSDIVSPNLTIRTNFDQASLFNYSVISTREIEFNITQDNGSVARNMNQEYLWFYFNLSNATSQSNISFKIMNLNTSHSGVFFDTTTDTNVVYACNKSDDNNWTKITTFSWNDPYYTFWQTFPCDTVYIATMYPYENERTNNLYKLASNSGFGNMSTIGTSVQERNISFLKVTNFSIPEINKKKILFISAQHPSETRCRWEIDGMIRYIINSTEQDAKTLRNNYVFDFIQTTNVDGVYNGISRSDPYGNDFNRNWDTKTISTLNIIRAFIINSTSLQNYSLSVDCHGDGSNIQTGYVNAGDNTAPADYYARQTGFWYNLTRKVYAYKTLSESPMGSTQLTALAFFYNNYSKNNEGLSFTFEPSLHNSTWTVDSAKLEGQNITQAIDGYFAFRNNYIENPACTQLIQATNLKQMNISNSTLNMSVDSCGTLCSKYGWKINGSNLINTTVPYFQNYSLLNGTAYNWTAFYINDTCTVNRNGLESTNLLNYTLNNQWVVTQLDQPNNQTNLSNTNTSIFGTWNLSIIGTEKYILYQSGVNFYNVSPRTNNTYNFTGLNTNSCYTFNITSFNQSYFLKESNNIYGFIACTLANVGSTTPPVIVPPAGGGDSGGATTQPQAPEFTCNLGYSGNRTSNYNLANDMTISYNVCNDNSYVSVNYNISVIGENLKTICAPVEIHKTVAKSSCANLNLYCQVPPEKISGKVLIIREKVENVLAWIASCDNEIVVSITPVNVNPISIWQFLKENWLLFVGITILIILFFYQFNKLMENL